MGRAVLIAVRNMDQEPGREVSSALQKSQLLIRLPSACSCFWRLQSLHICSSILPPSATKVQKKFQCTLIIPSGTLTSKIVSRASHTPHVIEALYV